MRRGAKPAKAKGESKRPVARKSRKRDRSRVGDLEKRLADALKREAAALEQQTATSEVLRAISGSPTDAQPVLDIIALHATRVCGARDGAVLLKVGTDLYPAAHYGPIDISLVGPQNRIPIGRDWVSGRALLDRRAIQVEDLLAAGDEYPRGLELARANGHRTTLATPLLREGEPMGVLLIRRGEVRPFTDKQISLLEMFAAQAVIAIENVRLFNETKEALEQQTATSEILRVISTSPTDLQPVFETIAENAVRLCDATVSGVLRFDGALIHLAAYRNFSPAVRAIVPQDYPMEPTRRRMSGRAILDRTVVHAPDVLSDPDYPQEVARSTGWRSFLSVPMLREGQAIGAVTVVRTQPGPFSDRQIALLKTFADQAVIAIENVRLFTELQEKNRALTEAHERVSEALDQQTATSEILRVISSSPTDAQPVFDTIVRSSDRLLGGLAGSLALRVGDEVHLVALTPTNPGGDDVLRRLYPMPIGEDGGHAEVVRRCRPLMITDTEAELTGRTREFARIRGFRSRLSVPLIRDGIAIGSLGVTRAAPGAFTDREIALLQTFADQAVIAIENVRLFTELQEKNQALTEAHAQVSEALEQQTATSEILQVISQSRTEVEPVFETIARNAVRLCGASQGGVYRFDGELIHSAAHAGFTPEELESWQRTWPQPVTAAAASVVGRAIRAKAIVRVGDVESAPDLVDLDPEKRANLRARGTRSLVAVPMRRGDDIIGAIALAHPHIDAFSDAHVDLLKTFADQAVIAIENVRLFNELQARTSELTRSVGELTALGEVGRALSSTLNLEVVLQTIVTRANQLTGTAGCVIWEYDKPRERFLLRVSHYADDTDAAIFPARGGVTMIPRGQGLTTQVMEERRAVQIPDITVGGTYESPVRKPLIDAGHRALLGVPLLSEDEVVGVLAVTRKTPGEFAPEIVRLLTTFATQSALAIQNARLFLEIEDKSRQLEVASQHKSEFLANMSHELRTPLNAVIGFSEVLLQRMFGELNDKQDEYLKDIYVSGQHLLSLINDILDLSKIEAGRMDLDLTDFDLPTALDNALTLVRERAGRRGITLGKSVDARVGMIQGDERKVKQVLLNLLSNALKFTPEGGRIDVRAALKEGTVEISVTDTGVGIAPEDQEAIFEEFRQVGTSNKKVEGTGLGLALSRRFVELHGGRIWVQSQEGVGSTFTFTIPVRSEP